MAAAVPAAAFLLALAWLPASRLSLPGGAVAGTSTVTGAFHIHTNRSDGSGTPDEVAAAAADSGLNFIVLTDHGDGTRTPDAPQYRSGVLVIDAVELSTSAGHYIAIGLPPVPYPIGGEARDVVEDVRRFGGFGIVAHPDSTKPGLRWQDWTAPFDAIEWLNADSEWRDEPAWRLGRALLQYPVRPVEALGSFLDRPELTLSRWDSLTQSRRVVALAGADAHARAGWRDDDANGYGRGWFVRIPSYETSFRAFANRVNLDRPFKGDAAADGAQLLAAIRAGRLYSAIDAVASPAALDFSATSDGRSARQGDLFHTSGRLSFAARVNAPSGGVIVLRKDGASVAEHAVPELQYETDAADGTYRIEVYLSGAPGQPPVPWIVSNPIYVRAPGFGVRATTALPPATDRWGIQGGPWHVEKDPRSTGEVSAASESQPVTFSFRLGDGEKTGQYAALVLSAGDALRGHARLGLTMQASRPMRISVQARQPQAGRRWTRSIFVDSQPRDVLIPFNEMRSVGIAPGDRFDPASIDTLLFVIDTTNAQPGSQGSFTVSEMRVEH